MTSFDITRRHDSGFTVVAILILVSLMASLAATFSRHVIVDAETSVAASTMSESAELIDSHRDYVLQSERVGRELEQVKVAVAMASGKLGGTEHTENASKQMQVDQLVQDSHSRLYSRVLGDNGLGATRLMETVRVPAAVTSNPATLPTLDAELAWSVLNDPAIEVMDVATTMTLSGTEFEGLIVIREGATLTLDDVIIHGSILSASATLGTVSELFSDFLGPRVVITGMTRILSGDAIPGVAILLPDGQVTAENPLARVQIQGDVIAHSLHLLTSGSFAGNVATVVPAVITSGIDRIGSGRSPRPWSPALDHHGAWEVQHVAVVPTELTLEDVTAITQCTLPARNSSSREETP